jgi:hypothetical protein
VLPAPFLLVSILNFAMTHGPLVEACNAADVAAFRAQLAAGAEPGELRLPAWRWLDQPWW